MDNIYIDFEYRQDGRQLVLCCVWNHSTGERHAIDFRHDPRSAAARLHELQQRWHDAIWFAYAADAEISAFLTAGLDPAPMSWICLLAESRQITGTHKDYCVHRANLPATLQAFGLPTITTQHKEAMRQLILATDSYTPEQWQAITDYCWSDLEHLPDLWQRIQQVHADANKPYLPELAVYRAEYLVASAMLSHTSRGFPINTDAMNTIFDNHTLVCNHLIERCNAYYQSAIYRQIKRTNTYAFSFAALEAYIKTLPFPVDWQRTPAGRLMLEEDYLSEFSRKNEHFKLLAETRTMLNQLKRSAWRDQVNHGFLKGTSLPYYTTTGRNQPMVSRGFLLNAAPWLRHLIKPQPNHVLIAADWSQQEIVLAAALSGDAKLIDAIRTGDVYLALAKMAGAVPDDATKHSHPLERQSFKSAQLGIGYGMGSASLGKRIFLDLRDQGAAVTYEQCAERAAQILNWHKETFCTYWSFVRREVNLAKRRGWIHTIDGWTYFADADTPFTKIQNFPMQANAAVILREAVKRLAAARSDRVQFTCSLHDALYVYCHEDDATIAENLLRRCMDDATKSVMQFAKRPLPITVEFKHYTHYTGYTDARGTKTYQQIMQIIDQQNTQMAA